MIILTLWVTGLGLLSSSSSITLEKWLSCQIGCPSWLSRDNYRSKHNMINWHQHTHGHTHKTRHPYLQHQGDTSREESHEHKVVGQDRHAAKAAHDFQLSHTWNIQERYSGIHKNTREVPLYHQNDQIRKLQFTICTQGKLLSVLLFFHFLVVR